MCGPHISETRLTAAQQRRAAITLVAAGVHAFTARDTDTALDYLDPGDPAALPEAGPAIALAHALGGRRDTVRVDDGASATGAAFACGSGQPSADARMRQPSELCGIHEDVDPGVARVVPATTEERP